ncbi:hypothetical protein Nisw_08185 [Candidatus Nitrosopumilus sp. SW]|uniref:hypothetical protein n=1 Tax=Candidatus Nitrosopumilus sp. SW TaxID=2508726 RepID=UPI00114E21B2|nr:hypothetical protein [Candidatus Nitrosopumilus sp. SW]QDI89502.1 hypothetical protein Nisw_08185 [Candidatus Nitrosopumilus sp. SW]
MADPLKERLEKLRKISESAKRRASLYSDVAKIDDKHTARSLGALQKAPAPGKKLQKIGFLMLWIPEPTGVTCAVGGPMIVAGRYLEKKYNSATIHDIGHQTKNTFSSISDFKTSVMNH